VYESGVDMKSIDNVMKNLNKEVKKIHNKTKQGMISAMLDIARQSVKLAPSVVGNLRASSFVTWGQRRTPKQSANFKDSPHNGLSAGKMASQHSNAIQRMQQISKDANGELSEESGTVGFSSIYALKTHENVRSGATGGTSPSGKPYKEGSYAVVGEWKFLETNLKKTSRILEIIKKHAKI